MKELNTNTEIEDSSYYPKYMLYVGCNKYSEYIVRFDDDYTGEVVAVAHNSQIEIGYYSDDWMTHTNMRWQEVTNPDILCDKDLVECWDNGDTHMRTLKFYDDKNKCTYSYAGGRNGINYGNYRKLMPWEYPQWAIEAQETLED